LFSLYGLAVSASAQPLLKPAADEYQQGAICLTMSRVKKTRRLTYPNSNIRIEVLWGSVAPRIGVDPEPAAPNADNVRVVGPVSDFYWPIVPRGP
jgi:hypothetical protein